MWLRFRQMDAKSRENGMVSATMNGGASIEQKQEKDDADQDHALGQVVHHRVQL